jgi:hypothetical protein
MPHQITTITLDGTGLIATLTFDETVVTATYDPTQWVVTDSTGNNFQPDSVVAAAGVIVVTATASGASPNLLVVFGNLVAVAAVQFTTGGAWLYDFGAYVPFP